jgi:hypothetical protein
MEAFESGVRECFGSESIQNLWCEDNKMYIAITEDDNWYKNKCVLCNYFFDYKKFKMLNLQMDCHNYGVYVFWK